MAAKVTVNLKNLGDKIKVVQLYRDQEVYLKLIITKDGVIPIQNGIQHQLLIPVDGLVDITTHFEFDNDIFIEPPDSQDCTTSEPHCTETCTSCMIPLQGSLPNWELNSLDCKWINL